MLKNQKCPIAALQCLFTILLCQRIIFQMEALALLVPDDVKCSLFTKRHVFLTVNAIADFSTAGQLTDRRIEVNWQNFDDYSNDDWVGLFNVNPAIARDSAAIPIQSFAVTSRSGVGLTKTRLEKITKQSLSSTIAEKNCLGYWVGYFRTVNNNTDSLIASNCLRAYPSWMNDLKGTNDANIPLHSLMIPGTHNSGAWKKFEPAIIANVFYSKIYTQEMSIYNQLLFGIRYLDVRPAYYPETKEIFWVNHGIFQTLPLMDLLSDVIRFIAEYNEVVIMDFHRFPVGFGDPSAHEKLYKFVVDKMGSYLAPNFLSMNVTLNLLWEVEKPIIWTYNINDLSQHYDLVWPGVTHAWGNTNNVQDLESYLEGALTTFGGKENFWSAMAEFTAQIGDILNPFQNLRNMAQEVNLPLTYWFQRKTWYSRSNIVSTDFFLGNNIIEMSVMANQNRKSCLDA